MLSGGQKQRVGIARALLTDPLTLVLDDSTSSVDWDTELRIHRALKEWRKNKTVLVIAHRVSTARQVNRILVFDGGRLVQMGTHHELVAQEGLYHDLFVLQSEDGMRGIPPLLWEKVLQRGAR